MQCEQQQDQSDSEHESAELMKSSSRPLKYQEDLPVFKSHDNMGAKKTQHNRNAATSGYSLEAQQHFYQRYNTIKANESVDKKQANLWHAKSNSMKVT